MAIPMTTPGTRVRFEGFAFLGVPQFGEVGTLVEVLDDPVGPPLIVEFGNIRQALWPSEVRQVHDDELVVATLEWEDDFGGAVAGLLPDGRWITAAWVTDDMANEMSMVAAGAYEVPVELCQCGHTGGDHCGETVMTVNTHRCIRCECLMYEPVEEVA